MRGNLIQASLEQRVVHLEVLASLPECVHEYLLGAVGASVTAADSRGYFDVTHAFVASIELGSLRERRGEEFVRRTPLSGRMRSQA